ncbi:MAG: 50S ribosomal protein L29 [bacterium]|nr:50S ribosomal protein L29 [bacterium]
MKASQKINEWSHTPDEALKADLRSLKEKQRSLRFLLVSGKLKNVCEVRELRKDIARISTVLKQKSKKEE